MNAGKTQSVLKTLIRTCDEIQIAVAWGYNGKLADILMDNSSKFHSVTFGLNGFATSPDLVDRLIGTPNAFIAKADNGIFHPKLYLFRTGNKVEAIVGSANFTNGGLDRNHEACLHIRGSDDDGIFGQIQSELSDYDSLKQPVSRSLSDCYRRQYDAARKRRGPRDPILPNDKKNGKGLTSELAVMSWGKFVSATKEDVHFKRRMVLLRNIQRLFASVERCSDLSIAEWKGIAGTLGNSESEHANLSEYHWDWFGSMKGLGSFASLIAKQDRQLAAALDCIPRKDTVTFESFKEYSDRFKKAFKDANADRIGGYPTATRLLAMKRPDTFVCLNGKNKRDLAKALNFAPNSLSMENYWDLVIVPIQSSPWYNATRPDGSNSELWDYRVAMLDAIYYNHDA